jgi:hypothetical protein
MWNGFPGVCWSWNEGFKGEILRIRIPHDLHFEKLSCLVLYFQIYSCPLWMCCWVIEMTQSGRFF